MFCLFPPHAGTPPIAEGVGQAGGPRKKNLKSALFPFIPASSELERLGPVSWQHGSISVPPGSSNTGQQTAADKSPSRLGSLPFRI